MRKRLALQHALTAKAIAVYSSGVLKTDGLHSADSRDPLAESLEKDKSPRVFLLWGLHLVRLAGIEPTTPWFVAKYSIQLSYSR